ncbi:hypothetical protein AX16_009303 [Volvariella volvacea WC 439]|nr:hypothetical protein AX16_009303 [Volvariella volvacea WC 439]
MIIITSGAGENAVDAWVEALENHIKQVGRRFDCAKLFGELFKEWLTSGDSSTALPASLYGSVDDSSSAKSTSNLPDAPTDDSFVDVGRIEKIKQKEKFNSIVFEDVSTDVDALKVYLEDLFSSEAAHRGLAGLRADVRTFGGRLLRRTCFDPKQVKNSVNALLSSGLMEETKRATLKEILNNETVQQEVASVLNMRMSKLDKWTWPEGGVEIEFRRHLNGKYRAYTDPDIIDAILLQHLGVEWQIILKRALLNFFNDSEAWLPGHPRLAPAEVRRLETLGLGSGKNGIEGARQSMRAKYFFLSQLSTSATRPRTYEKPLDIPVEKDNDTEDPDALSSAAIKQKLLHILATECNLNKTLYKSHAIIRSDFEWFGPSLPHSSILTILEFLGMSKKWLSFYKRFLEAPLKFKEDPAGEVRIRKRGTPISYALSVVCGEAVMFIMDFAVNQRAKGMFLYRMHDDLWLWDKDARKCALAWKEMQRYAELVGIKFNMSKTGSAVVINPEHGTSVEEVKELLPQGDVRWGFLTFSAEDGRFKIDQKDVDLHIQELRRQLDATKSVFGWVNLYNKYMAFFLRNFGGRPVGSYGDEHIQDALQTLARIQRELFAGVPRGVVGHLKGVLEKKFDISDLPEGYFHLPITFGGLEVKNPLVDLLALIPTLGMGASLYIEQRDKRDQSLYRDAKESFEYSKNRPKDIEFLTFEEYSELRETHSGEWAERYHMTLEKLEHRTVEPPPDVEHDMQEHGLYWNRDDSSVHLSWALALHGSGLLKHFGSIKVVDEDLIPVGMVEVYRSSRIKLDQ